MVSVDLVIKLLGLYAGLSSAVAIMCFALTPSFVYLLARVLPERVPLHLIIGENRMKIVLAKIVAGVLKTKHNGEYRITAGSGYQVKKVISYFAYDNYGATMPFNYAHAVEIMRENGHKIETFEDLQKLWENPKTKEEIIGRVKGQTLTVKDLQYMWPANDNPFVNEAKSACDIAVERLKGGKDYFKYIIIIGGVVIIAFVAYSLFKGHFNPEPISVLCKFPEQIVNGAQATGQNLASNLSI